MANMTPERIGRTAWVVNYWLGNEGFKERIRKRDVLITRIFLEVLQDAGAYTVRRVYFVFA